MADADLRELERRWRASGASADEGAYLAGRVRAGDLSAWRLELARACGHPALGGPEDPPLGFEGWLEALPFAGKRGGLRREWVRVPIAAARALEPAARALGVDPLLADALAAAEAAAVGRPPGDGALDALLERVLDLNDERHPDGWEATPPDVALVGLADVAVRFVRSGRGSAGVVAFWAGHALEPSGVWSVEPGVEEAIEAAVPRAGGRLWRLREAIAAELIPWALGRGDPVRERVESGDDEPVAGDARSGF